MPNWASDSLSDDPTVSLNKFQNDLTVSLISTPRASLKTCASDEKMDVVAARNRADAFDFLPVTEPEDARRTGASIVGLIEMTHVNPDKNPVGIVRDYMVPLSEQNLIGSDASILRFLLEADRHRCRLVVSATEISGLVSISDLQKLPVRAALFAMITHLEMIMADNIRREFDGSDDWMKRLSSSRKSKVQELVKAEKMHDTFVDMLLYTNFSDKIRVIENSPHFDGDKKKFHSELYQIQELRNVLAHAMDVATDQEEALRVIVKVRLIDGWSRRLAAAP